MAVIDWEFLGACSLSELVGDGVGVEWKNHGNDNRNGEEERLERKGGRDAGYRWRPNCWMRISLHGEIAEVCLSMIKLNVF